MSEFTIDSTVKVYDLDTIKELRERGYELKPKKAVIIKHPSGEYLFLDEELVGFEKEKDLDVEFYAYEIPEEGSNKIIMSPSMIFKISLEKIMEKCDHEEMSVREFMGDRYNYNARIARNTTNFLQWMNGKPIER